MDIHRVELITGTVYCITVALILCMHVFSMYSMSIMNHGSGS